MGDIFTWCSTTSDAMAEWTSRFELAHFICLKAPLKSKLILVGRCRGRETEKCENRRCFPLYLKNQRRYGKLEAINRFSSSNRSICLPNGVLIIVGGAWSMDVKIHRKSRKSEAFFIIPQQAVVIWQIRGDHWIQHVK